MVMRRNSTIKLLDTTAPTATCQQGGGREEHTGTPRPRAHAARCGHCGGAWRLAGGAHAARCRLGSGPKLGARATRRRPVNQSTRPNHFERRAVSCGLRSAKGFSAWLGLGSGLGSGLELGLGLGLGLGLEGLLRLGQEGDEQRRLVELLVAHHVDAHARLRLDELLPLITRSGWASPPAAPGRGGPPRYSTGLACRSPASWRWRRPAGRSQSAATTSPTLRPWAWVAARGPTPPAASTRHVAAAAPPPPRRRLGQTAASRRRPGCSRRPARRDPDWSRSHGPAAIRPPARAGRAHRRPRAARPRS
eukprot:scaffold54405_cov55-Phaeocystis_antarctica.AAC.11